jgi:ribonuclease PH
MQAWTSILFLFSISFPSNQCNVGNAFQQSHPWILRTPIRQPSLSSTGSSSSIGSFATSTRSTSTLLKESSYYSIESDSSGPGSGPVHRLIIHKLPGQKEEEEDVDDDEVELANDVGVVVTAEDNTHTNGESDVIVTTNGQEADMPATARNDDATVEATPPSKPEQKKPEHHHHKLHPIVVETGRIGRQAAGAVTLTRGDTVLYATAARDESPRDGLDFLPLSVEHQERFSSVGQTSGGYSKRDGRPAEHEVLTCRLIDRPLRPLIADGWRHETQLLSWVMSYDGVRSCDPLAIIASSTALYISDVPLTKAVAAAMVGYDRETDTLMLNPTNEEMAKSQLQLIVAGTKDAVLMIEGAADFLPEETMIRAVKFGHDAIRVICEAVEEFGKVVGKEKNFDTLVKMPVGLQQRVDELVSDKVDRMYELGGTKTTQSPVKKQIQKELIDTLTEETEEHQYIAADIKNAFKDLLCRRMFVRAKETGKRCDGRNLDEIRELSMEAGFLPRVHGSALFTRGETQVIATSVSLFSSEMGPIESFLLFQ